MRENDTIERYNEHEVYEAAASVTGQTVLQETFSIYKQKYTP
jgi:hypothetical protein